MRDALERHVPLAELVEAHPALGADAVELLAPGVAVTRRTTPGGAGARAGGRPAGALRRITWSTSCPGWPAAFHESP